MDDSRSVFGIGLSLLAVAMVVTATAADHDDPLDVIREHATASIQAKVTGRELAKTPISSILCSNFIEVGFGYQVEGCGRRCCITAASRNGCRCAPTARTDMT